MNLNQHQKEGLRNLPAVDHVLELSKSDPFFAEIPRSVLIRSIRSVLDNRRRQIIEQDPANIDDLLADSSVVTGVKDLVRQAQSLNLRETVNATGIVIHTNLGRSLAPAAVIENLAQIAGHYSNLEYDLGAGKRGSRFSSVEDILCEISGAEAGVVAFSVAMTEIARACASTAVTVSVNNMVCEVIQALGSMDQREKYIPRICSGEYLAGAFGLTESGAGSDPASMTTSAVRDGDSWILNGSKIFITSGSCAGVFVVWAVTDPAAPKGKGVSVFLVEPGIEGFTIGKAEKKMGQHASKTNELLFQDCRLPAGALMGKLNDGFRVAVTELAGGRIGIGSLALGVGLAAMDAATSYSLERIRQEITITWQTRAYAPVKTTVAAEREHVLFYISEVLYEVVPVFYETLRAGLDDSYPELFAGQSLPRVPGCSRIASIKPGARVLAEHPTRQAADGRRLPAIVIRLGSGSGRAGSRAFQ